MRELRPSPRLEATESIPAFLLASVVLVSVVAGCRELSRFTTGQDDPYCGSIVGGNSDSDIDRSRSMVRRGFGAEVQMKMTFDASNLDSAPGTLTTSDGLLSSAPMRPIPELFNDALFALEFGEGRDKNLLYVVDPSVADGGPSINVVLSLLHSGDAEVRLFRGAAQVDGGAGPQQDGQPLFGVFAPLERNKDVCSKF
jgi:hypothetical protein